MAPDLKWPEAVLEREILHPGLKKNVQSTRMPKKKGKHLLRCSSLPGPKPPFFLGVFWPRDSRGSPAAPKARGSLRPLGGPTGLVPRTIYQSTKGVISATRLARPKARGMSRGMSCDVMRQPMSARIRDFRADARCHIYTYLLFMTGGVPSIDQPSNG